MQKVGQVGGSQLPPLPPPPPPTLQHPHLPDVRGGGTMRCCRILSSELTLLFGASFDVPGYFFSGVSSVNSRTNYNIVQFHLQ